MRAKTIITLLFMFTGFVGTVFAGTKKPWPKLHEIVVNVSVIFKDENFGYHYTVINPPKNKYPIHRIEVDLRIHPKTHPLSREDLTHVHTVDEHMTILENAEKNQAVQICSPEGWESIYPGLWGVDGLLQKYMIQPGTMLSGWGFTSNTPPSIGEFVVGADSWDFFNNPEDYKFPGRELKREGDPDEFTTEVNKGIQILGKTLVPGVLPKSFNVTSWTARMESDAVEARALGWIKTDKNLAEIKKLISGLNTEDKDKLKAAVKKIEIFVSTGGKKGNLTDEAGALIRLNALYLLQRLEKPEGVK